MMEIKKIEDDEQIVFGEVYAPVGIPDADGDVMSAKVIETMAHTFMKNYRQGSIDIDHDGSIVQAVIVETFIARESDPLFIPGAWVIGVYVEDQEVWGKIKSGELNGFSIQAIAKSEYKEIEIDIPESVGGETVMEAGHTHTFIVKFDRNGRFVGGKTDIVDGHYHDITRGTITNESDGHIHKFSFVELFSNE
jgi:hypothetical protein